VLFVDNKGVGKMNVPVGKGREGKDHSGDVNLTMLEDSENE